MVENSSDWSREFARGTVRDSLSRIVDEATPGLIDRLSSDSSAYEDLIAVTHLVTQEADELLRETVISARHAGLSWEKIGNLVGMSRQAAQQRFSAGLPAHLAADSAAAGSIVPASVGTMTASPGTMAPIPGTPMASMPGTMIPGSPPIGTTATIDEASDDNIKMLNRAGQYGWRCVGFTTWTWTIEMTGTQWAAAATLGREPAGGGWTRIGRWAHMVYWTKPNMAPPIPNSPDPDVFSSPKKFKRALDKQRQLAASAASGLGTPPASSLSNSLAAAVNKLADYL